MILPLATGSGPKRSDVGFEEVVSSKDTNSQDPSYPILLAWLAITL